MMRLMPSKSDPPPHHSFSPQVHWALCVQESVQDSVVARLRLRMAGMKCVALRSDEDRLLVDAAIQEAQQQGATVSLNREEEMRIKSTV